MPIRTRDMGRHAAPSPLRGGECNSVGQTENRHGAFYPVTCEATTRCWQMGRPRIRLANGLASHYHVVSTTSFKVLVADGCVSYIGNLFSQLLRLSPGKHEVRGCCRLSAALLATFLRRVIILMFTRKDCKRRIRPSKYFHTLCQSLTQNVGLIAASNDCLKAGPVFA